MINGTFARVGFIVLVLSFSLYFYLDKQNDLTRLKMEVPKITKELRLIHEENRHLVLQIEQFENPSHLMELARLPQYSHLKHPFVEDILTVPEGIALDEKKKMTQKIVPPSFAFGDQ